MVDTTKDKVNRVLATDLDGTLIPLDGNDRNRRDLEKLAAELHDNDVTLVFLTDRRCESALQAIDEFRLPPPSWLISDGGACISARNDSNGFEVIAEYQKRLEQITAAFPISNLRQILNAVGGLDPDEVAKEGSFKLRLYTDPAALRERVLEIEQILVSRNAPYSVIPSIDPFDSRGLIDFVPNGVSQSNALAWWGEHAGVTEDAVVFAGDSSNNLEALTAGYRAIVVNNANRNLARQVFDAHRKKGWHDRLFFAQQSATSGVLEGCQWFGLAQPQASTSLRLGATPLSCTDTQFRVWAPRRKTVELEVHTDGTLCRYPLLRSEFGYFGGTVSGVGVRSDYQYVLDGEVSRPDPAASFQPDSVHGPSRVIDPHSFPWSDQDWQGVQKRELIIYEMHVGVFTEAGTFQAAISRLDELVELGMTAIELLPVAHSPGRWNWGYDGVNLFAVRNTYGEPDDFKAFIDACHAKGLAVILDVVYNHLGPEGNYLSEFGPYFSSKHCTPWGDALNFDGRHASHVRQFIVENALRWFDEFHLDGLRLDAIHFMMDDSQPSIVDELAQSVSQFGTTTNRHLHLIAESNLFDEELLSQSEHGPAYDAIWCDCFMHAVYSYAVPDLRLTQREYRGAADIRQAIETGYVYAGRDHERISRQKAKPNLRYLESLVIALQTHDSVGNHPHGRRLHQLTSKAFQKAAASLMLLYPSIPMLFMGEESAVDCPFPFFVDFQDRRLRAAVDRGRAKEYAQHDWRNAPLPSADTTFHAAKCHDPSQHDGDVRAWYRSVIQLRKQGLADAWLSPERLTTAHDERHNIFSLKYINPSGGAITVFARLNPLQANTATQEIAVEGEILVSSQPLVDRSPNTVLLEPSHAIIVRSE